MRLVYTTLRLTRRAVQVARQQGLAHAALLSGNKIRHHLRTRVIRWAARGTSPSAALTDLPDDFDYEFYRTYYSEFRALGQIDLEHHYCNYGRLEGRFPNLAAFARSLENKFGFLPPGFDPVEYLRANPHLAAGAPLPWHLIAHYLEHGRRENLPIDRSSQAVYTADRLHHATSHANDMPGVVVDPQRPPTVNILVPAFDFGSMSAGFFGVFQVALFIRRCGINVRLVLYDRFAFDLQRSRMKLKGYPGLEDVFDLLEVEYIGDRTAPLRVSPHDNCVATVWYSAYLARKIMEARGGGQFLYLIQDYEPAFHPANSSFVLAEATYSFDYAAFFSTEALQQFFIEKGIGVFAAAGTDHIFYNNACSRALPSKEKFLGARRPGRPRRLAFYSRPPVHRNLFEIGALALQAAHSAGVFAGAEWEFIGIGLGEAVVELGDGVCMKQMERMNLSDYQKVISTFDIGLSLMASPHPSLLPFDLAGSGAVVVTNSYAVKDQAYFDRIVEGVIVAPPDVPALVSALRRAVAESFDLNARYARAAAMRYPTDWKDTFGDAHVALVRGTFADTFAASR